MNGAGGSPKDRVALKIITEVGLYPRFVRVQEFTCDRFQAEEQGLLTPNSGDKIYEGTVGSTGISLATICRAKGYLAHM